MYSDEQKRGASCITTHLLSGRRRQTLETLVRAAGAALLDVPALRRTFNLTGLMYGVYNVAKARLPFGLFKGVRSERYEGDFTGVGISYGYHFILSPRWGLETSIGVGFLHTRYERYRCAHCGEKTGSGNRNFIAPTKASISLVYMMQ
ncbi:hypothetical protein BACSTE_02802 [Bacteroides stercoris ATCC 43183]|uniref:DUF3575 domain-containing protein n=1 Tax=Bacteroides stercoris ATCC 43183 TaxID=449673 RepID=B0NVA7_BACSE|nr:hypothetical protein BACSTE_02802 [Bacteroides stercoris ATCC 43183]